MTQPILTDPILSPSNPRVKDIVQLHRGPVRQDFGQILIEGPHPVREAAQAGLPLVEGFVLDTAWAKLESTLPSITWTPVSKDVMSRMATTDSAPPVIAVATKPAEPDVTAEAVVTGSWLALTGLQDPGNLGTLARCAVAFGMSGIILVGDNVDPVSPKVIRASAGLIFRLPILRAPAWVSLKSALPADMPVWAADTGRGDAVQNWHPGEHGLLVLGAEGPGLPEAVWDRAKGVHIPMTAHAESLNVALAGGILLNHWFGQRKIQAV